MLPPRSWLPMSGHGTLTCAFVALGRLALVKGIRRLFLPHVGMRGSVKHLFEEFRNSLWGGRGNYQDVSEERRQSHHSPLHQIPHGAWQRKAFLPGELQSLREVLCELVSHESCGEWLRFNGLSHPDTLLPSRLLASLIRKPDLADTENIRTLRMYPAAA